MISFLNCTGKAVLKLILSLTYQEKDRTVNQEFEVSTDKVYKVSAADNNAGIVTFNGRITGFTMTNERETLSFVNGNTKPREMQIYRLKIL